MQKGKIIAIEGIDGSGKTSVCASLARQLSPSVFRVSREPTDMQIGGLLRKTINEGDEVLNALLFAADHRQHIERVIAPTIAKGLHVISDRYLHSHLVYQTVMLGGALLQPALLQEQKAAFNRQWLRQIYSPWAIPPDLTIFLQVHPEIAAERLSCRGRDLDQYEQPEHLKKLAKEYNLVFSGEGEYLLKDPGVTVVVDTDEKNPEDVLSSVKKEILKFTTS